MSNPITSEALAISTDDAIDTFHETHEVSHTEARQDQQKIGLLNRCCYPVLLMSALLTIFLAFHFDLNFGLCNMVFLVWAIGYLALCERLIPYKKEWHPTAREWGRDALYLFMTMMGGALAVAAVFGVAAVISPLQSAIPLWLEIPIALLLSSLGSYVFHRAGHELPWLWRFHGIHHTATKINVSNNALNHVLDVFGRRFLAQLPTLLLGVSQPALFVVSIFNTAQGYFVHANVNVRLGRLNYIVGSPEQHRFHHSVEVKEAGHFSVDIPLWDWLFGSYIWRKDRPAPEAAGIKKVDSFPPSNAIVASFLHPFRKKKLSSSPP